MTCGYSWQDSESLTRKTPIRSSIKSRVNGSVTMNEELSSDTSLRGLAWPPTPLRRSMESEGDPMEKPFQYSVVRYVPNLVRDEGVNVGLLVRAVAGKEFDFKFLPRTATVRKLWPHADERIVEN